MTSWRNLVRVGVDRPALRGALALTLGAGLLLLANAGRALSNKAHARPSEPAAQDTAQVSALLTRVRGVDPTVCHLIGRALGNRWGNWYGTVIIDPRNTGTDDRLLAWLDGGEIQPPLVPPLRRALSDGDVCVRHTASQLLGRARVADLSAELRSELGSTNAGTREAALTALGHFDKASGLDAAGSALHDPDANVRAAAAWVLGMIERGEGVAVLSELARDPAVQVRRTVAWALGAIENRSALPTLITMLSDAEPSVRIQAAHALGSIESADAVTPLLKLLESDRDPQVRRAAAAALGRISG